MFHNMLLTSLTTPLCIKDEINCWENKPFTTIWPEVKQEEPKVTDIAKPIKKKLKRLRTAYTTEQLRSLEKFFSRKKYITAEARKELADRIKITEKSIKIWFQNRRMKEKRDSDSSYDGSSESHYSASPPILENSDVIDEKMEVSSNIHPKESPIECNFQADAEVPQYQLPAPYEQYVPYCAQNNIEPNMHFYYDNNVYPTQYYPNTPYYPGQYVQNDHSLSNFYENYYY